METWAYFMNVSLSSSIHSIQILLNTSLNTSKPQILGYFSFKSASFVDWMKRIQNLTFDFTDYI